MRRSATIAAILVAVLALGAGAAYAQSLSFQMDSETVDVFFQPDGTYALVYAFHFINDPGGAPIDFIDVGLPGSDYNFGDIRASLDGQPVFDIATSPFVDPGVAVGLGNLAIPPGRSGTLVVEIDRVGGVLYRGDDEGYASGQFSPTWFGSEFVHGATDLTVVFHLPPGLSPDEPRWHTPRGGWPTDEPVALFDPEGRITYTWRDPSASGDTQYIFGASFPDRYVDTGSLQSPPAGDGWSGLIAGLVCFGQVAVVIGLFVAFIVFVSRRVRPAYLPPKIAIEGHGIKRGLTAVEAAVLLQTGLDKVLTMILFAVIKKGAARVVSETPLKVEAVQPLPEDLRAYETSFLEAVALDDKRKRQRDLTEVMIQLVKAVESKMKGFSLKETREYYTAIIKKAWAQVEEAQTPEMKSERFTESMEWTMMDRDFDRNTRRTIGTGPVYLPQWWGSYRPSSTPKMAAPVPSHVPSGGGQISLPHLPGADFAASFARGVQNTASSLVSNVTSFTNGVIRTTNPPPPPSKSSSFGRSSGGHSCACACACAGCACACAGGGR